MHCASAAVRVIGFSTSTAIPRCRADSTAAAWAAGGVATSNASATSNKGSGVA
jgi:hypothetical protein